MNKKNDLATLNALCDKWLSSWSGNQPDVLIEFYSDDAFYMDPARPQGLHGRKELSDYFKRLLAINPEWKWTRKTLIPNQEGFGLIWTAEIPVKTKLVVLSGMDRIVLRDDMKIERNEVYFDTKPLFE